MFYVLLGFLYCFLSSFIGSTLYFIQKRLGRYVCCKSQKAY